MKIAKELKTPAFVISLLVNIILSFYSIYISKQVAKPTYILSETPSKIYDSKNKSSQLRVIDNKSNIIDKDIYLTNVIFWNSGNISIDTNEVRYFPSIEITNCKNIIEYKIIKQVPSFQASYKLFEDSTNDNVKRLFISWKQFYPKDCIYLQILYVGSDSSKVNIKNGEYSREFGLVDAGNTNNSRRDLHMLVLLIGIMIVFALVDKFNMTLNTIIFRKYRNVIFIKNNILPFMKLLYISGFIYIWYLILDKMFPYIKPPF